MYCFWKCDEVRVVELQRDIWNEYFYSLFITEIEEGLIFVRSGILYQEINLFFFIKVIIYQQNFQKKQMLSVRIGFGNANLSSFIFINRNKCKQTHYRGPYCLRQHKYSNLYYFILVKKIYKIVTFAYFFFKLYTLKTYL